MYVLLDDVKIAYDSSWGVYDYGDLQKEPKFLGIAKSK